MHGLLIKDCDVLSFKDQTPEILLHQDILVEKNRILEICPTPHDRGDDDCEQIDGTGMLAVPGMINTHAHVPMVLFRGAAEDVPLTEWFNDYIFPMESNLTPEDVYWGALLGIAEMIESGITYVADHYFFMDEVAEAIQKGGIRANLAWAVFEHEGLDKLNRTSEFIQRWQGKAEGRIKTWLGPHSPYLCGPAFLRTCAHMAEKLDVGVHIHVAETREQVEASLAQYGQTPIQLLMDAGILDRPTILAHCLYPTEEDLKIIGDHPAGVGQAPKTYLRAGMGLSDIKSYQDHHIPLGLATDGAASSFTLDLYEQMRLMALTQKFTQGDARAARFEEILRIAFLGGAEVSREPELGALKPGNFADIVLLRQDRAGCIPRLNPAANLVYSMGAGDVNTVICNGQVVMRDRMLLTIDKDEVKNEVEKRLERLVQRVPGRKVAVYPT
jgi:5-methylthioadenosine/S-adenosylhomocysteine deaminase